MRRPDNSCPSVIANLWSSGSSSNSESSSSPGNSSSDRTDRNSSNTDPLIFLIFGNIHALFMTTSFDIVGCTTSTLYNVGIGCGDFNK